MDSDSGGQRLPVFTVIVLDRGSSSLLSVYGLLFEDFIESGQLAICRWNEEGRDLASALPDLPGLIKGKTAWRAVVVVDHAVSSGELETTEDNPFDYLCNRQEAIQLEENAVPLVRLTHMLAGFPELGVKRFEACFRYVDEKGNIRIVPLDELGEEDKSNLMECYGSTLRRVERPVDFTSEEKARHKELTAKYAMHQERPVELILVATRATPPSRERDNVRRSWDNRVEGESSGFWKRSDYPEICRFLFFDLLHPDNVQFQGQLFRLWLSVLTLALNRVAPSALQAYHLYRLDVAMSQKLLEAQLGGHLATLKAAQGFVQEAASVAPEPSFDLNGALYDDQVIPVRFAPGAGALSVNGLSVGLASDRPEDELTAWADAMVTLDTQLDEILLPVRRDLQDAAADARHRAENYRGREYVLDPLQAEQLKNDIQRLEGGIFSSRAIDTIDKTLIEKQKRDADGVVRKAMAVRMKIGTIVSMAAVGLCAYLMGYLSYLHGSYEAGMAALFPAVMLVIVSFVFVAIGGVVVLFGFREQLKERIEDFNATMSAVMRAGNEGARVLQGYLTGICTYMKAQSILSGMRLNQVSERVRLNRRKAHTQALRTLIDHETELCDSLGLIVDVQPLTTLPEYFDPEMPPRSNSIYRLPRGLSMREIEINTTGYRVSAPYEFLTGLTIERVETYDNAENGENDEP